MLLGLTIPLVFFFGLWLWDHRRERTPRFFAFATIPMIACVGTLFWLSRDLVLQKTAGFLVMPAGLLWLALFFAASFFAWRRERRAAAGFFVVFVGYSLLGSPYVGSAWIAWLESDIPVVDIDDVEPFDAVFVLGGGTKISPHGAVELSGPGDRVLLGARLYHAQKTPLLIASGRSIPGLGKDRNIAKEATSVWRSIGVPDSAMLELSEPRNTSEEIRAYKALIEARSFTRVGVVSSAWHLPRVLAQCEKLGLDLVPLAADHRGGTPPLASALFIPQTWGFSNVQRAAWETVGMLVGR